MNKKYKNIYEAYQKMGVKMKKSIYSRNQTLKIVLT